MKQLDLFAGIGGISLAAEWAGIETVAFCEKEPFAQGILRRRFPGRPIYSDIYDLTKEVLENDGINGIDIVAGGFPCQPFSHAGKRNGTADDRYLWPQMCRIVNELRPSWVFAENVDGLVSMAQSDSEIVMEDETTLCTEAEMVVESIRKDLQNIGYRSVPIVIPASAVGAMHRRYRIFIVAYCDSKRHDECGGEIPTEQDSDWEKYGLPLPNGQNVAHSDAKRLQRGEDTGNLRCNGQGCRDEQFTGRGSNESRGSTQPGVGRDAYGIPNWLDGWGMNPLDALIEFIRTAPQPAPMGMPQHDWEPPRVATGVKNRVSRLKALGNAVDPLQALPVLYGIRVLHEQLREEAETE